MHRTGSAGSRFTAFWSLVVVLILAAPAGSYANPLPTRTIFGRQFRDTSHVQISYAEFVKDQAASVPALLLRDGEEIQPRWRGPFASSLGYYKNRQYFHACDCSVGCGTRVYETLAQDAGYPLKMQVHVNPSGNKYPDDGVLDCFLECNGPGRPCSPPPPGSIPWPSLPDQGADAPAMTADAPPIPAQDMAALALASAEESGCAVGSSTGGPAGKCWLTAALLALFGLRRLRLS